MTANRLLELQQQLDKRRKLAKKTVPHQGVPAKKTAKKGANSVSPKAAANSLKRRPQDLRFRPVSLRRRKRGAVKAQAFDRNEPLDLRYDGGFFAVSDSDATTVPGQVGSYRNSWLDSSAAYEVESFEEEEKELPLLPTTNGIKTKIDAPEQQTTSAATEPPPATEKLAGRGEVISKPDPEKRTDFVSTPVDSRAADADAFERDIQAILRGEKTAQPEEKPLPNSGAKPPQSEEEPETEVPPGSHAIFARLGKNLSHATTFNLGAMELKQRFDDFDRAFDREQQQSSTNIKTIPVESTEVLPPAAAPEEMDLVEDLAIIEQTAPAKQAAGSLETEDISFSLSKRPSFSTLNGNYTEERHDCPDISTSPNQCAVRVSRALIASGIAMDSDYEGKLCRHGYARGAQDLGAFLKKKWGVRDYGFEAPNKVPPELSGKKGVIMFANIPDFDGQGHIDLWDGNQTRTGSYWNANPIWFWKLPD